MMAVCRLCPRNCGIDRDAKPGFCGQSNKIKVARASLHMWEEPCISGKSGSGTIFFSGCSLHCVFCQNSVIANEGAGREVSLEELVYLMLELQEKGANNINLVTAGHFLPQVVKALEIAKKKGLKIPIVYNTGSYEKVENIQYLEGLVDIYLPDLKYVSTTISQKYSHAEDYFEVASAAIEEMVRQTGQPVFEGMDGGIGLMTRGTIVRHLILPGCTNDSKAVIKYLYEKYGDSIFISIMNQYTPLLQVKEDYPELYRKVTKREYNRVLDYAIELGLENGFFQEGDVAMESFIPDFLASSNDADKEGKVVVLPNATDEACNFEAGQKEEQQ